MFGLFHPPGIWYHPPRSMPAGPLRPGLFLDRDGVLAMERNYLRRPQDVVLTPEVATLVLRANVRGVPVAVVTNQSGIDRGILGWEDFCAVEAEIAGQLAKMGAAVDLTAACPFHPDFTPGYGADHDFWRKPGPGLLKFAGGMLGIDLGRSCLIGDKAGDIQAAKAAGLAYAVFLRGGDRKEQAAAESCAGERFVVRVMEPDGVIGAVAPVLRLRPPPGTT
jgi:D-glycero-D-manno-heptose 1,7-bisphosphate phosphatase